MDTENKALILPPSRNREPHFSLSREAGFANGAKDLDWLDTNIPCQAACPAHTRIPDYLDEINQGNYDQAYLINLVHTAFPAVLGRVCSRPCEDVCRHGRDGLGEPVAICFSKRAAADHGNDKHVVLTPAYPETGKTVAVIGGGPAGLAAARELALYGHKATVYEKYSEAGGMMNQGIPEFRLPRDVICKEIEQIEMLGVEIRCNQNIGTDITVDELLANNDAVIIAAGTLDPNIVDLPGKDLGGIQHGLEFLLEANEKGTAEIGKRAIVIGGGFTAMDCARTALRLNSDVAIYYRRSREEMSVPADELAEVEHEEIPIEIMAGPMAYLGDTDAGISNMRFIRNELGEPDDSGRRRPVPIEDSEFEVQVDTVLLATGQWQDTSWLGPEVSKHVLDKDGWVKGGQPVRTEHPALFLAGDYSIGASTLIEAIGHAKTCAREIDEFSALPSTPEAQALISIFFATQALKDAARDGTARLKPRSSEATTTRSRPSRPRGATSATSSSKSTTTFVSTVRNVSRLSRKKHASYESMTSATMTKVVSQATLMQATQHRTSTRCSTSIRTSASAVANARRSARSNASRYRRSRGAANASAT